MPTFIKAGFWTKAVKGYKEWLNLDALITSIAAGSQGPQGIQGPTGPQGVPGPVGPAGLTWQGSWTSGTSYVADDAVGYAGASWFNILATSGTTAPDIDTTHWALLASQGAIGPTGATGAQGPTGATGPSASSVPSYSARLYQSGTNPPAPQIVFQNTLTIGNNPNANPTNIILSWQRSGVGKYTVLIRYGSAVAIDLSKIDVSFSDAKIRLINAGSGGDGYSSYLIFNFESYSLAGVASDDIISYTNIYIKRY